MKKKLFKKIIASLLIVGLLAGSCPLPAFAATRTLTEAQAEVLAMRRSQALKKNFLELTKKQVELKEAREAVRETRRRENSWSFSLLFSIKAPEKHDMPKEMELLMAIPQLQMEIQNLQREQIKLTLDVQNKVRAAYLDICYSERMLKNKRQQLADAESTQTRINREFAAGRGEKSDVEYMENRVRDLNTEIQRQVLNLDKAKVKLGQLTGLDMRFGYSFEQYLITADTVTMNEFEEQLLPYAEKYDYDLYFAQQERRLSEVELDYAASVFGGRYSAYAQGILSYISMNRGQEELDVAELQARYEATLEAIDKPWAGAYKIRIIFFTISIPKEWFMRRFSGLRYLGDEKYILMLAAVENDKKIRAEEQAYVDLHSKLRDTYDILREMEFSLKAEQDSLAQSRLLYANALRDNRMGLASFSDVESQKQDLLSKEDSIYALQVDLAKTIAMFNFYSSNYMEFRLNPAAIDQMLYASGMLTENGKPEWVMRDTVVDYKFEFSLANIPEELSITHYDLFDADGFQVGGRTAISDSISHLPLTYSGSLRMLLKFYAGNQYVAYSEFDGGLYGGELDIITDLAAQPEQRSTVYGLYRVEQFGTYRGELAIMIDELIEYDGYALFYEGKPVGERREKGQMATYAEAMFRDLQQLEVAVYRGRTELYRLKLRQTSSEGPASGELYR